MTDERMDQTFRELQAELTVTPSPAFAAKVRALIAEEAVHSWFGGWRVATAAVVIGGVAFAVVIGNHRIGPAGIPLAPDIARSERPPSAALPAIVRSVGTDLGPARAAARVARGRATAGAGTTAIRGPEVLVPADQRIALAQLLQAMRDRGTRVPALTVGEVDSEGRLPAPAAIDVAPIVIQPLGPPIPGGGSTERR